MAEIPPVSAARSVSAKIRSFSPAVNVRRFGRSDSSGLAAAGAGPTVRLRPSSVPAPAAACASTTLLGMTTRQFSYALKSKLPGDLCLIIIGTEGRLSPLDPETRDYWAKRRADRLQVAIYSRRRRELLQLQGYTCAECGIAFDPDEDPGLMDEHHAQPRHKGGGDELENLRLVHRWCHHRHHQKCGYKTAEA